MLGYLRAHSGLPIPDVLFASHDLLLLTLIDDDGELSPTAEENAADYIAALHEIRGPAHGFERDTPIGRVNQPNPWSDSWLTFFAEHRLMAMASVANSHGMLPLELLRGIETVAGRLPGWLQEPLHPSLIHGDLWRGNILTRDGRVSGIIDPAIYYADPEIELAYATLFNSLGDAFFRRYTALRPLTPGFFEIRRDIYTLYPLLVHVLHFGTAYLAPIGRILARLGR